MSRFSTNTDSTQPDSQYKLSRTPGVVEAQVAQLDLPDAVSAQKHGQMFCSDVNAIVPIPPAAIYGDFLFITILNDDAEVVGRA